MIFAVDNCSSQIELIERGTQMTNSALTIRPADLADLAGLDRLAALDSASPPTGHVLVAEVGGELWAAVDVDSGAAIADPFRPSGDLVELLRLHARGERRSPRRTFGRLLPRAA
jgi:hypothetical protein